VNRFFCISSSDFIVVCAVLSAFALPPHFATSAVFVAEAILFSSASISLFVLLKAADPISIHSSLSLSSFSLLFSCPIEFSTLIAHLEAVSASFLKAVSTVPVCDGFIICDNCSSVLFINASLVDCSLSSAEFIF
jgi:hypothetical protein